MGQLPEVMTASEAAEALRISTETVRRWGRTGALTSTKVGRQRRYFRSEIEAMLATERTPEEPVEVAS